MYTKVVWTDESLSVTFDICWPSLLYAAIGRSTWPVTSTHTGQTCESGKQQYKQWHWQLKPFWPAVARIALAIEYVGPWVVSILVRLSFSSVVFGVVQEMYFENMTPPCSLLKLCDWRDVCNLPGLVICDRIWEKGALRTNPEFWF